MSIIQQILLAASEAAIPPAGGYAYYAGENNANDTSGNARHATLGSEVGFATGKVGQAFNFTGAGSANNNRVNVPSLNLGSAFSIECWVYTNAILAVSQPIVGNNYESASNFGTLYINASGFLTYYSNNILRLTSMRAIPAAAWIKVMLTYDGSKIRMYYNGVLIGEETGTHSETFNNPVGIGRPSNPPAGDGLIKMIGKIDEIKFSDSQVAGKSGLIHHYAAENNTTDTESDFNATAGSQTAYTASGQSGSAFLFNGNANSRILLPQMLLKTTYSIEFYLKPTSSGTFQHVVSNAYNSSAFGALYFSANKIEYWQNGTKKVETTAATVPLNVFTKIKMTYDGNKTRLYIADALSATESGTHSETYNNQAGMGANVGTLESSALTGVIDEVKIYNSVV